MAGATDKRKCEGTTVSGIPCNAPACAGDIRCRWHGGRRRLPPTCNCSAYSFPHRPGGGSCRPDAADPADVVAFRWPGPKPPGTNKPTGQRRRGPWGQLMKELGLHPIRDAATIRKLADLVRQSPWVSSAADVRWVLNQNLLDSKGRTYESAHPPMPKAKIT